MFVACVGDGCAWRLRLLLPPCLPTPHVAHAQEAQDHCCALDLTILTMLRLKSYHPNHAAS